MTTELLRQKTARYLCGVAIPAEKQQIQTWLSCTDKTTVNTEDRQKVEDEIVGQVMAYVDSTLNFQSKSDPWWKKITASF